MLALVLARRGGEEVRSGRAFRSGVPLAIVVIVVALAAVFALVPLTRSSTEAALVVLVLVGAAIAVSAAVALRGMPERQDAMEGVLTTTTPWLPGAIAVVVVALFLFGQPAPYAIGYGLLITALLFLAVGVFLNQYARIDRAQARNYAELVDRATRLGADFKVLGAEARLGKLKDEELENAQAAREELGALMSSIDDDLGLGDAKEPSSGRAWAVGTGYIDLWNRMHRAEEALIDLAADQNILASAEHDKLRLEGSNIGHSKELLATVETAMKTLRSGTASTSARAEARRQLRNVRRDINKFRDDVWDQMLDLRNTLLGRMIFTGIVADLLLITALVVGVEQSAILGASAFYLVGAVTGLFSRLQAETQTKSVVDDYGLADARLMVTPLISGLAAIAGVVLTAKLILPGSDVLAPASIDDSGKVTSITSEVRTPPQLGDIFDLDLNPGGLVVAAIFGLTPGLVLDRLKSEAERYKSDIQTSSATDGKK
jgi:hypothetical protein